MEKAPTYQDLARQKAEQSAAQSQTAQMNVASNEAQSTVKPNPILAEYMSRNQQGLIPSNDYVGIATAVANSVPNQDSYSKEMVTAALNGSVPVEGVLSDDSILPEYRQGLMQKLEYAKGLGSIGR